MRSNSVGDVIRCNDGTSCDAAYAMGDPTHVRLNDVQLALHRSAAIKNILKLLKKMGPRKVIVIEESFIVLP